MLMPEGADPLDAERGEKAFVADRHRRDGMNLVRVLKPRLICRTPPALAHLIKVASLNRPVDCSDQRFALGGGCELAMA